MLRAVGLAVLIVLGLAGTGGGGTLLALELTRHATAQEVSAAAAAEVASRWQRLPAGAIFPAKITYDTSESVSTTATLVGVARPAGCAAAMDPAWLDAVRHFGCVSVLRATYVDASGTLAVVVGIVVTRAADTSTVAAPGTGGVRTMVLPGSAAGLFGDAQRAVTGSVGVGPYIYIYASGHTDGRIGQTEVAGTDSLALTDLSTGVMIRIQGLSAQPTHPCVAKDIQC